jgi:membrane-associated phospholipid phosphatase
MARVPRDCFPSLHTANTFLVMLLVWRQARKLAWLYIPLGSSCIAATIYLRYHYTIDVMAGLVLGGAVFVAVPWLSHAWETFVHKIELFLS